ncbi:Short Transient Receptor Potential Channel 4 [Manis pentadactyla]|nr:Short Transient Receptor Potential Channel 4 [Manis pentadactyla]
MASVHLSVCCSIAMLCPAGSACHMAQQQSPRSPSLSYLCSCVTHRCGCARAGYTNVKNPPPTRSLVSSGRKSMESFYAMA